MQLERIAIALRPRSGWEAVDLGFGMARSWWRSCYGAFWITYLPLAAALLLAFREQPLLAAGVLWWLKPAFDRFVLHALSRHCFGAAPSLRELLGAWREVLSPSLLWSLTLARLSPARSYLLPVSLLERQTGADARERRKLLSRRFYGNAAGLLLVCVNLELIVQIGLSVMFSILLQPGEEPLARLSRIDETFAGDWWGISDTLWYIIAVCLIEPLYVAGGFALYLNRRVILEGWDVELALKRLAARLPGAMPALLLALAFGAGMSLSPPLQAQVESMPGIEAEASQDDADQPAYGQRCKSAQTAWERARDDAEQAEQPTRAQRKALHQATRILRRCQQHDRAPLDSERQQAIVEILSDIEFGRVQQVERWRLRERAADDDDDEGRQLTGLATFFELLASLWQILMWVALAVLLLYLGRLLAVRWLVDGAKRDRAPPPTELFGLAIAPESLPEDVAGSALALLEQGRTREALALVYRASLSQLVHGHGLQLPAGATEGDVLRAARTHLQPAAQGYLEALLRTWVDLAYAERQPALALLRTLIDGYEPHFGRATLVPAGASA